MLSYLQCIVAEPNKIANYNPRSNKYLAMDLETSYLPIEMLAHFHTDYIV